MADKIRVGIWGLGRAGHTHASELGMYPEMFELACGMDTDVERNRIFSDKYGVATYASEEDYLRAPDVDLISIATRSMDHLAHCQRALATGKYVFLEKPIALTYADALKLLDLDKEHPGKLFLRHNRRFEAPFNRIKEIIDSGTLGDVYEIKLCRHNFQRRQDWQTLIGCGGGQLNNWGPHIIDHALQFLNYRVTDLWSDLKHVASMGDAEDHLKIILKGEDGLVVDLEISGGVALPQNEYTVFGSRGALTYMQDEIKLKYSDPTQVFHQVEADAGNPPLEGGVTNGYADLEAVRWVEETIKVSSETSMDTHSIWPALYGSIREGTAFPVTIEQGVAVVKVTETVKKNTEFAMG